MSAHHHKPNSKQINERERESNKNKQTMGVHCRKPSSNWQKRKGHKNKPKRKEKRKGCKNERTIECSSSQA